MNSHFSVASTQTIRLPSAHTHKQKAAARSRQAGFTAIELVVVLVVIGILAVLSLRAFGLMNKSKGTIEAQNIVDTINAVQGCFSKATDFAALGASAAAGTTYVLTNCGIDVANPPSSATTTVITNQFGGSRTVARTSISGGTHNAVQVSDPAVPRDVCPDAVQFLWDMASSIVITPAGGAATTVKANFDQRYQPDGIAPCKAADTVTIDVVRAKNG